jgi:acetoin utilization deacetylase AcuC-like enzyme
MKNMSLSSAPITTPDSTSTTSNTSNTSTTSTATTSTTTSTTSNPLPSNHATINTHHYLTGIAHDEQQIMCLHRCEEDRYHPECPARLTSIMNTFQEAHLFPNNPAQTINVPVVPATNEDIHAGGRCHTLQHIQAVEKMCRARSSTRLVATLDDKSLYKNEHSLLAARHSCGACLEMTKAVLDVANPVNNGVVVARPPGHHAEPCESMGFCFFNNVGVAVAKAQDLGCEKIMIVDWDVHHGNGTQEMFAEDPNVLFISLHRYDNGTFYPAEEETKVRGAPEYIGRGPGKGATINIAWNTNKQDAAHASKSNSAHEPIYLGGIGDKDYIAAFEQIVLPAALVFQPALIYVSAGFDAAAGDPLGEMNLTPNGYGVMLQCLMAASIPSAQSKVIVVLEGGYNLTSIAVSALACLKVLTGTETYVNGKEAPTQEGANAIAATKAGHQGWPNPPWAVK